MIFTIYFLLSALGFIVCGIGQAKDLIRGQYDKADPWLVLFCGIMSVASILGLFLTSSHCNC